MHVSGPARSRWRHNYSYCCVAHHSWSAINLMRIVWIIKLERSRRTAAIVAVRAPAVHGVSSRWLFRLKEIQGKAKKHKENQRAKSKKSSKIRNIENLQYTFKPSIKCPEETLSNFELHPASEQTQKIHAHANNLVQKTTISLTYRCGCAWSTFSWSPKQTQKWQNREIYKICKNPWLQKQNQMLVSQSKKL